MKNTTEQRERVLVINKTRVDLRGADLRGADLRWSDFQGYDLRGADLRGADLRWSDLQGSDLRGAKLQGALLQGANLDYCSIELSCNTIDLKVDKRLVSQLLYHLCRMDVQDCPEWDELRNNEQVIALANQSHIIPVHEVPEIKPLKRRSRNEIPFRMEP